MRSTHLIAGACAAALIGAVTGASMPTDPLDRGIDAWDRLPQPDFAEDGGEDGPAGLSEPEALPDHYPLVTPRGRFEVAELRDRGLYRNRRFGSDPYWIDDPEPAYEIADVDYRYLPDEGFDYAPAPPERAARSAHSPASQPTEGKPLALAAADQGALVPALVKPRALAGGARVIDVAAELTARQ